MSDSISNINFNEDITSSERQININLNDIYKDELKNEIIKNIQIYIENKIKNEADEEISKFKKEIIKYLEETWKEYKKNSITKKVLYDSFTKEVEIIINNNIKEEVEDRCEEWIYTNLKSYIRKTLQKNVDLSILPIIKDILKEFLNNIDTSKNHLRKNKLKMENK